MALNEEDNAEKRQASSFMSYLLEIEQIDIRVKEANKIKDLLLSSLKNLSLPQAQLLVHWNKQCGIIEEECDDITMSGLPIVHPARDSIHTMQHYLQLKQIEIRELVNAIKNLFELVENINMRKERIVQQVMEKPTVEESIIDAHDRDEIIAKGIKSWLDNQKAQGNIQTEADVVISKDMCKEFVQARFNISDDKFLKVWDSVTGGWFDAEKSD